MRRTKLYISGGGTLIQNSTSVRSLLYYLSNISRIRQPHLNYRTLHAETDLIYRASTREEFHHA